MMLFLNILWLLLLTYIDDITCLVAFQCESRTNPMKAYRLDTVPECHAPITDKITEPIHVQILRPVLQTFDDFISCRIETIRTITHCGMHSHSSLTDNPISRSIVRASHKECKDILVSGFYKTPLGSTLSDLALGLNHASITEIGSVSGTTCTGGTFHDTLSSRTHQSVVVTGLYEIYVNKGTAAYDSATQSWMIGAQHVTAVRLGEGFTPQLGDIFFEVDKGKGCPEGQYVELYHGPAVRFGSNITTANDASEIDILVETDEKVFLLTQKRAVSRCGYRLYETDIDGVYISYGTLSETVLSSDSKFSLATYVDAKLSIVRKETEDNLNGLHANIQYNMCRTRQEQKRSLITLARVDPQEFAYRIMNGAPGYTAYVTGDRAYIIKCGEVSVSNITRTDACHKEIGVQHHGATWYMESHTRILKKTGEPIPCDTRIVTGIYTDSGYQMFGPSGQIDIGASMVGLPTDDDNSAWKWHSHGSSEHLGVYTPGDVDEWQTSMMTNGELQAVSRTVARIWNGQRVPHETGSVSNFFTSEDLDTIGPAIFGNIMFGIREFGIYCSAILGVMSIIGILVKVSEMVINCHTIHEVTGWSWSLLAGICSATTTHLLRKKESGSRKSLVESSGDDNSRGDHGEAGERLLHQLEQLRNTGGSSQMSRGMPMDEFLRKSMVDCEVGYVPPAYNEGLYPSSSIPLRDERSETLPKY